MGSCEIRFRQKQDYHVLNPLPPFYPNQLAETKVIDNYHLWIATQHFALTSARRAWTLLACTVLHIVPMFFGRHTWEQYKLELR
jgi:hypothetical protein